MNHHPLSVAAATAVPPAAHPDLFHGTSGLLLGYGLVAGAILVGRIASHASFWRYFNAPLVAIPVLLGGAALSGVLSLFLPPAFATVAFFALSLSLGFLVGIMPPRQSTRHHRGTVVEPEPQTSLRRPTPRTQNAAAVLTLAGIPIPSLDETKHFKLIGTTGTGKSTAIRELLQGALRRGDRAVIADPDAGYLNRFYDSARGDLILNPFDSRSVKWDLFSEIRDPYDFEQLARSLIPDVAGDDRVFRQYAQTFLTAAMRQAHGCGIRDSAELYRLLASAPLDELRLLLEGTPAQPFVASGNDKMFGSVRSVTTSAVASLNYINSQKGTPFSLRNWVKEGRGVLFLPYSAHQIAALHSVISTWMRIAIFETMTLTEGDARLWFIVDELDALGPIDGLKDALPRLRKFGGRCVLGFQSIAQVSGNYGRGEGETIVENCGNTFILRCSASEGGGTALFASRLIGEREMIRENISRSHRPSEWLATKTTSEQHVTEFAVLASEIEQLPDLEGYLKLASQPHWTRAKLAM